MYSLNAHTVRKLIPNIILGNKNEDANDIDVKRKLKDIDEFPLLHHTLLLLV